MVKSIWPISGALREGDLSCFFFRIAWHRLQLRKLNLSDTCSLSEACSGIIHVIVSWYCNITVTTQQCRGGLYVKFNGNWCWTSPTWSQVQFWSSWSSTRRSPTPITVELDVSTLSAVKFNVFLNKFKMKFNSKKSEVQLQLWTWDQVGEVQHQLPLNLTYHDFF